MKSNPSNHPFVPLAKKVGTLAIAGVMTAASMVPAFAASNDIIDTSKTGSMTIHKYDLAAVEQAGVDVSQFVANGEKDAAAESTLSKFGLQGAEFSRRLVGHAITYSTGGDVELLYDVETPLRSVLDLSTAEAETSSGDTYYYTSDQINTSLAELLSDGTDGKNKLEAYAASAGMTAMPETDADGVTTATNLEVGLYLVVETKVPENVYSTTDPFFVSIPSTDATGDYWHYDVDVYPKNQTNNPTLDKLVSENGTFDDTATVSEGDVLDYLLVSQLPTISSTATYLGKYTYVDVLSKGLAYNKDTKIAFYNAEEDAKVNKTSNAIAIWTASDNPALFGAAYENLANGDTQMTVTMTKAGLSELNTKYSDKFMVVYYTATVKSTADMVCGDNGNTNDVTLTYGRTNTTYQETLEDKAIVYTYGINLTKTFSDNAGDATKVQFVLKNATDGYYITATGTNGVYYAQGQAADEANATVFSPASNGSLNINGLEADQYVLTEIKTDDGYSLLKNDITILINETDTDITASTAPVTGFDNEHPDVVVTMNTSASATVDSSDATMSADDDSQNALVDVSVLNSKTFVLPQTGGAGTWLITICGVLGVAGGALALYQSKKKDSSDQ